MERIQAQRLDEAATMFDGSSSIEGWVEALRELHDVHHFKLLAYDNVKPEFDDGSFSAGHADLTFEVDGQPLSAQVILTFGPGGAPKQVCVITPPGFKQGELRELEEWNRIMCGGSF